MIYPHLLRISRPPAVPGAGSQDSDGVWSPDLGQPQDVEIYNGPADVQDGGDAVQKDNAGSPTLQSDAIVFLEDESAVAAVKDGDTAQVTWEDGTIGMAQVVKVRRLDGTIFLKRVV